MTREEIIAAMHELSDRLWAGASQLIGHGDHDSALAARVMMAVSEAIDATFDDDDIGDCEGEA